MVWKKTLFIFLSLSILLTIGFFIQRPLNNKEVLGVQDSNSKIINRPEELEVKTQPSITPSKPKVQDNSSSSSNISKRNYIQGEIDRLEQNRKANSNAIVQILQALSDCPGGKLDWCDSREKQDTRIYYDSITEIDKQMQEWKLKLADTY